MTKVLIEFDTKKKPRGWFEVRQWIEFGTVPIKKFEVID